MIILDVEQGFEEWVNARCGVVTMSHAKDMLTKGRGVTRKNYILDVASERLSGKPVDRIETRDMIRGIELEPFARQAYAHETGNRIATTGLAFLDEERRISASPDGITGQIEGGGVEIKCPLPRNHLKYLDAMGAPGAIMPQIQGNMWVFNAQRWDFVSFCPEFTQRPLAIFSVKADPVMIAEIEAAAYAAVAEIDRIVNSISAYSYRDRAALDVILWQAQAHMEEVFGDGEIDL